MKKINRHEFEVGKDPVVLSPGEMLATLRKLQGMSQLQLARRAKMNQSNISSMESGRQRIGHDRAIALAIALNVHPAVIMFSNYRIKVARAA